MPSAFVFDIQRFALHDGPGIRTVVFLKGCPARCPWCHNPESQSSKPELVVFEERCLSCGSCHAVCPNGRDPARCSACGACAEACPADARRIAGRSMSVAAVMDEVLRDRVFYEESGGGLTVSGGEPLTQPVFLEALLLAARAAGLSTAVDTCGFAPRERLLELAPLVDLFLFDLKLADESRHLALTGLPLAPILANLRALAESGALVWLRIPIVPGFSDDADALAESARLAQAIPGLRRVHLLPYHRTGGAKFRRLGRAYALADLRPPSPERMESLAAIFRARGLDARVGG